MKLSLNWLNDYIPIRDMDYVEVAQKMIMFGFEDTRFDRELESLEDVVVGKILKIERHPNADKLSYCQVDSGTGVLNIVCGATNIQEGNIVPLALEGAKLPNGVILKKSKIRGVESQGMMCSQKELQYGSDASGIFILPQEWEVGKQVKDYLNDYIVSYEVKSNRPDLLSHVGVSRELSGLLSLPFLFPYIESDSDFISDVKIEIENAEDCGRYVGKVIQGVEVKESGDLIRFRMNALGLQPRNNIVDISNYVLFELGHPVHIFDKDKIEGGKVIVRRAKQGEEITLLDGNQYKLDDTILVIADAVKPLAVAGIMGGLDSAVTFETKNIFIESAHFNPVLIRRGAKKLGLQTDASYRFERGTDIKGLETVADRVAYLVKKESHGQISANIDVVKTKLPEEKVITIRVSRTNQILGAELSKGEIIKMLSDLHFKYIKDADDNIDFQIPDYRQDVYREIDLIEEVGKLFGYNNLNTTLPKLGIKDRRPNHQFEFNSLLREVLVGLGLTEVINISIFTEDNLKYYSNTENLITIRNPVGQFLNKLRPTLLTGLVRNLNRNLNRGRDSVKIFEIGSIFNKSEDSDLESESLSILLSGDFNEVHWREKKREVNFFDLKGIVELLGKRF
ncbi:MAG: phenylalanine--tRNA ligase subunit beta, partial [bacterium]|nr:phenylalanine--tRNA ligase subunit beta [bacterium]